MQTALGGGRDVDVVPASWKRCTANQVSKLSPPSPVMMRIRLLTPASSSGFRPLPLQAVLAFRLHQHSAFRIAHPAPVHRGRALRALRGQCVSRTLARPRNRAQQHRLDLVVEKFA